MLAGAGGVKMPAYCTDRLLQSQRKETEPVSTKWQNARSIGIDMTAFRITAGPLE